MEFPKKFMRSGELRALGLSKELLRRAYGDSKQRFATKVNPAKRTSAIIYDTDGLKEWIEREIKAQLAGMERT